MDVIGALVEAGAFSASGFQKLPPITSAISTSYDWNLTSMVVTRGIAAGETATIAAPVTVFPITMPSVIAAPLRHALKLFASTSLSSFILEDPTGNQCLLKRRRSDELLRFPSSHLA